MATATADPATIPQLVRTAEVARLFQIHPSTVREWAQEGRIPGMVRVGRHYRFQRERLAEFVRGQTG